MKLKVLYEDNHIIVVVKESGVLSQASSLDMPDMLTIIKQYLKDKYQKPGNVFLGLVHRLDLNVGGVMVFAKTSKAAKRLNDQMKNHLFSKKYLAVVRGDMPVDGQVLLLENYLKKDSLLKKAVITDSHKDQLARLRYQVLETAIYNKEHLSLLDVDLETGRFHQIRVQLANIGHPLFGDNKYGLKTMGYELGLFAYELSFNHPISQATLLYTYYPEKGVFTNFNLFRKQG